MLKTDFSAPQGHIGSPIGVEDSLVPVEKTDCVILSRAPYRVRDKLRGVEEYVWQQLLERLKDTPLPIHEVFSL